MAPGTMNDLLRRRLGCGPVSSLITTRRGLASSEGGGGGAMSANSGRARMGSQPAMPLRHTLLPGSSLPSRTSWRMPAVVTGPSLAPSLM